jgi:hypothetical protein
MGSYHVYNEINIWFEHLTSVTNTYLCHNIFHPILPSLLQKFYKLILIQQLSIYYLQPLLSKRKKQKCKGNGSLIKNITVMSNRYIQFSHNGSTKQWHQITGINLYEGTKYIVQKTYFIIYQYLSNNCNFCMILALHIKKFQCAATTTTAPYTHHNARWQSSFWILLI